MWNEELNIYGYHDYNEGKPVSLRSYSAIQTALTNDYNHVSESFINLVEQYYGHIQIVPRRGTLKGSVAIAQIPGTSFYLRANSVVHPNDNGVGSKKRGRSIATARAEWFLNWFQGLNNDVQIAILSSNWREVWDCYNTNTATKEGWKDYRKMKKATSSYSSGIYEVVEESLLHPMERRILGVDRQKVVNDE
ncbi:MAG TPA: hypothetical protein VMW10_03750 [Alphaproteobacteria bacterium]|nr:hypothetical protein [Alphaproteobacteria bacterium]